MGILISLPFLVIGGLIFYAIYRGISSGGVRYKFLRYERNSQPVRFWFDTLFLTIGGVFFCLAGITFLIKYHSF
jgi:hypothetical protein